MKNICVSADKHTEKLEYLFDIRWILVCVQFSLKVRLNAMAICHNVSQLLHELVNSLSCQGQKWYYISQFVFGFWTPDLTNVTPLLYSSALHYRWVSTAEIHFISISVVCSCTGMSLGREKGKHEVPPCWGAISLATLRWKCYSYESQLEHENLILTREFIIQKLIKIKC